MAPKMASGSETPLPLMTSGAMTDGSKRRGDDQLEQDERAVGAPLVIHYVDSFDLKRLEHMVISYQGSAVIASYPNRPWEYETIGSLVEQVQPVISPGPRAMAKPKVVIEDRHVPPDVREVLMEDALLNNDFAEFQRWQVVTEETMVIPNSAVAMPSYDVKTILLPSNMKSYEDWSDVIITMPAYRGQGVTFGDLFTQSFRDTAAEAYARFIFGKFQKDVPSNRAWISHTQGPDLAGFLMASNWAARIDSCKASVAGGNSSSGYRRTYRGCKP